MCNLILIPIWQIRAQILELNFHSYNIREDQLLFLSQFACKPWCESTILTFQKQKCTASKRLDDKVMFIKGKYFSLGKVMFCMYL